MLALKVKSYTISIRTNGDLLLFSSDSGRAAGTVSVLEGVLS